MVSTELLFFKCFRKWPPAAIFNDRKSLSIAILAISDQCANDFRSMAAGGHFGSPIWAILDNRKSLLIKFLPISDQYRLAPKTIGFFHYVLSMAMPNMKLIGEFMTKLETPQSF